MPSMFELGQQVLAMQSFSGLLGTELVSWEAGVVELRIPIRPDLLQQHGFVHGGVISYAADNALTFAGGSVLGVAVITAEFKLNYLKPAQGEALIARASVVGAGRRQAVCRCDVFASAGGAETLCATALGTIVLLGAPAAAEAAG